MKVVITLLVVLHVVTSAAQSPLRIKFFHNTDNVEKSTDMPKFVDITRERIWSFRRISLAIEFGERENLRQQIELFFPQIQRPTSVPLYPLHYSYLSGPYKRESTAAAFRYEVVKKLGDRSDRIRPLIGFGLNPYYQKSSVHPILADWSSRHQVNFGGVINGIAGVEILVSNRFSLEASIPVKIYDLRFRRQTINNPTLTREQQLQTSEEHIFFESAYTLRLGVIYGLKTKAG